MDDPDVELLTGRASVANVQDGYITIAAWNELIARVPAREPPGPDPSPLKQSAIEAAINLRNAGKRVTASAVRKRLQNIGIIVRHTNRTISNWIGRFGNDPTADLFRES